MVYLAAHSEGGVQVLGLARPRHASQQVGLQQQSSELLKGLCEVVLKRGPLGISTATPPMYNAMGLWSRVCDSV